MTRYVDIEREKGLLTRVENLKKEWDQFKISIGQKMAEPSENIPLNRLREFFKPDGPTNWGRAAGGGMVTLSADIYFFLERVHNMIMDLDLEVDENVTIPQALAAASQKTPSRYPSDI